MFHAALETVGAPWQVVAHPNGVEVLVAGPTDGRLGDRIAAGLAATGARVPTVVVRSVDAIPRTALGKAPLVRTDPAAIDLTARAHSI